MDRQVESLLGCVIAGKYLVRAVLDHLVIGTVFDVEHIELGTPLALTLIPMDRAAGEGTFRRLVEDTRRTSQVDHPNIVEVADVGDSEHGLYIAVERLSGPSLRDWLDEHRALPSLAEVGSLVDQLLAALETLHRQGIMHRDVKPENIFLSHDESGRAVVKVLNLAIAYYKASQADGPEQAPMDLLCGAPECMNLSQYASRQASPKADLYAVGCVLTELLQRRAPFATTYCSHLLLKHVCWTPSPLARPRAAEPVPEQLEVLRLRLLARDPGKRPHDAAETRDLLSRALSAGERTKAHDAGPARLPAPAAAPPPRRSQERRVGVLRPHVQANGVTDARIAALAAEGLVPTSYRSAIDVLEAVPPVLVLDIAGDIEPACTWLDWLSTLPVKPHVIVCISDRTADTLRRLFLSGADDVMMYPILTDALAERIRNVHRQLSR